MSNTLSILVVTCLTAVFVESPPGISVPETSLDDPGIACGQGYSEAKWVGEQMLYNAAKETTLRPIVLRVGQIAGGVNGGWNTSDWVPAMIKSSVALGCLPVFEGVGHFFDSSQVTSSSLRLRSVHGFHWTSLPLLSSIIDMPTRLSTLSISCILTPDYHEPSLELLRNI